ncbi:MAG TPA: sugar phosphate isomerase/epimerase family protein [Ktedonobacteraceae bacterium]|nr:sugar phosphate isomerase/epimerase family protein [Ktedonobacteraceae bacterium]
MSTPNALGRLSLNQMTTKQWNVREAIEGCARAGIPAIGLWREKIAEIGVTQSARLVRDAGIAVSSLCRGGWFPAASAVERRARLEENFRAVEEAAELGADVLVLVCGPAPDRDIAAARAMVREALERLLPFAEQHRIKLGIEPLHPMFAADRSVIVTLGEALHLLRGCASPYLGVVIDVYHVWWDPAVYEHIEAARGSIFGFHVNDWLVPTPHMLNGRGMMGDGVIELRRLRQAVDGAGYRGPIEVEIFNEALWSLPGEQLLKLMCERFLRCV